MTELCDRHGPSLRCAPRDWWPGGAAAGNVGPLYFEAVDR